MTDRLQIPYRDREQPVVEALADLRSAIDDPAERSATRHVLVEAATAGARTVGQALDHIEALPPTERRRLVEAGREAAGHETLAGRDWRRLQESLPLPSGRDANGCSIAICAAEGCSTIPVDDVTGAPRPVAARRWWCSEHEHLAAPGDLDPYETPWAIDPQSGALYNRAEREIERNRAEREAESRRTLRASRRAERETELAELRDEERARGEYFRLRGAGWEPLP